MTCGGLHHGGETHHVSCGEPGCGGCSNYHGGGHVLCSGCGGSSYGGSGHSCLCGSGHDGHVHGSCYAGGCGGDGVQSSDVCGSHDDGDYAAHLNDVSDCVNMTDYVCVAGDNVLETVSDCSALVLDNVHHSDHS